MSRRPQPAGELELVPIMNLVSILIPFLLMAASFVDLAVLDVAMPAVSDEQPEPSEAPEPLSIDVTGDGFVVRGEGEPVVIRCARPGCPAPEDYDTAGLSEALERLKDEVPERQQVVLAPDAAVPYEVMIAAMDAARARDGRVLFPGVIVAAGLPE